MSTSISTITPNLTRVETNGQILYFSYTTLVAFATANTDWKLIVCENVWTCTTGAHLTQLQPDKKLRTKRADFEALARANDIDPVNNY